MRMSILIKTFLILLISFSIVFLLSMYLSYQRFSKLYIEENIKSVKNSILNSISEINQGADLKDTNLNEYSSETSFIRFNNSQMIEEIGPSYLDASEVLDFVISIYDSDQAVYEDQLVYFVELKGDIYHVNYIYQFELGDYLLITTRIQSLRNVDAVLNQINVTQSVFTVIAITLLSIFISLNISKPIKKISLYAKDISHLKFDSKLNLKRKDEFQDLISSLNEMTYNLQKTYSDLNAMNQKLNEDIDFEKEQEEKKKHLIMTINHEIKTPLAVMKGMICGMIDGVGRYKDKDKYLNELLTQIESIEHITEDLTYSIRLEDKIKLDGFTHTKVLKDKLVQLDEFAKQHEIKLIKKIEMCNIQMTEDLFIILSSNLIKNAILYNSDKNVWISGEIDHGEFIFTVRNKGEIPLDEIEKIFDSFRRTKSTIHKKGGSGLGLFIVKQIAELYGYPYKIYNDHGEVVAKVQIQLKK